MKDRDVNHRAQAGAACEGLDPTRLKLNTTTGLIAPVVVLSHDRPGYLGRTLMTLLKCVQGVRPFIWMSSMMAWQLLMCLVTKDRYRVTEAMHSPIMTDIQLLSLSYCKACTYAPEVYTQCVCS